MNLDESTITLALDWTPNSNHTGFYVAQAKGWYKDAGLKVNIEPPSAEYCISETPARRIVQGSADLCIAPSESLISCWTSEAEKVRPIAVAAVLQHDTSSIAVKEGSSIDSLAKLDGKRYASYNGRFEMAIIKQAIKNAGGSGDVIELIPPKLDCFDDVLRGDADATWIFSGWEGVLAKAKGVHLTEFRLSEAGVPYGYSPLLLAHPDLCSDARRMQLQSFLAASERGFQLAHQQPAEAALCLLQAADHPTLNCLEPSVLQSSQEFLSSQQCYLDADQHWGTMKEDRWEAFLAFLTDHELITYRDGRKVERAALPLSEMFRCDFLPR